MRLDSQKLLMCCILVAAGCTDGTGPDTGPRYARTYELQSVGGLNVPAIEYMGEWGSTIIISGTLTLERSGKATTVTHVRQTYPGTTPSESDVRISGEYRIHGDSIEVGGFGPCGGSSGLPVMCAPNRFGLFADPIVTLTWSVIPPTDPVYVYSLVSSSN